MAAQPDADSAQLSRDEEAFEYNPSEHRKLTHPTKLVFRFGMYARTTEKQNNTVRLYFSPAM